MSNIVTVGNWERDQQKIEDKKLVELYEYLIQQNVVISFRRGLIRFSSHVYTNSEDIEYVLNLIDSKKNLKTI